MSSVVLLCMKLFFFLCCLDHSIDASPVIAFSSDTEPESASVIEAEYDQLREKAREHAHERGELFHRVRWAFPPFGMDET